MTTAMRPLTVALVAASLSLAACTAPVEKHRNAGVKLYGAGQYDQAMVEFNQSLKDDASDPVSNAYAAAIHYRAGNLTQAVYHAKVSLQFDPANEEARNVLVAALVKQGKADQALDDLERLSALADKTRDPRHLKSVANRRYMKETEEKLFMGRADSRFQVGRTYERLGDYDNAKLWYERALKESPENPVVLLALAKMYDKVGNKPGAVEYAKRTYAADPAAPGLVDVLTRNGVAISDLARPAAPNYGPLVPAPR